MPVIRVPDPVFERLQNAATPLVDTPGSVIEKLLDFYEAHQRGRRSRPLPSKSTPVIRQFRGAAAPDLRFTRILSAEFDGQSASNWNELVHVAHRRAMARVKTFEALRSATHSNIAAGRRSGRGFHYLSDINVSVQNVDANLAWRNTVGLASKLRVPVSVTFEWRDSKDAAQPGRRGAMSWAPGTSDKTVEA